MFPSCSLPLAMLPSCHPPTRPLNHPQTSCTRAEKYLTLAVDMVVLLVPHAVVHFLLMP